MPNYCSYQAHVKGKAKAILTFNEWMNACYHYVEKDYDEECRGFKPLEKPICTYEENGVERNTEHHIGGRVFSFDIDPEDEERLKNLNDDEIALISACGDCAWSCRSCMFDGPFSYYDDITKDYGQKSMSITITDACKQLNLAVEIWSEEPGMCFSEHYIINANGELTTEEEFDFYDIYIEDFETFDDYVNDCEKHGYDIILTKDQFDEARENGECFATACEALEDGCWPFSLC